MTPRALTAFALGVLVGVVGALMAVDLGVLA